MCDSLPSFLLSFFIYYYGSLAIHLRFTCDSVAIHLRFSCDSVAVHLRFICGSFAAQLGRICGAVCPSTQCKVDHRSARQKHPVLRSVSARSAEPADRCGSPVGTSQGKALRSNDRAGRRERGSGERPLRAPGCYFAPSASLRSAAQSRLPFSAPASVVAFAALPQRLPPATRSPASRGA